MGWRVGIAELRRAVDLQPEATWRTLAVAIAEVTEAPGIARALEQLCVFECDLACLTRADWKDPRTNESLSCQLDQGRVPLLTNYALVDGTRLRGVHRLAAQLLVALPE